MAFEFNFPHGGKVNITIMTYQTEYVKASKDAVRARGSRFLARNQKSTRNSNRVDFWFSFEAPVERALEIPSIRQISLTAMAFSL
jgi:hypothetical protein